MILKKYSLVIFTVLLSSVQILAQSATLITIDNQEKSVKYMKIAVNSSILVNEINKAFQEKRPPLFPPGVVCEYARLKILDLWKYNSFKIDIPDKPFLISLENGNQCLKKISIQAERTNGYMDLSFSGSGEILDININIGLNPGIIIPKSFKTSCLPIARPGSTDSKKVLHINKVKSAERLEPVTDRWRFEGSAGYGFILGRDDYGYGVEAQAGYRSGKSTLLYAAVGFNQYTISYETPVLPVNKQFIGLRAGATFYPYKSFAIEAGIEKTLGDFNAFGVTAGLGYSFLGHYKLYGRYFYFGESEQQIVTISIGYAF